MIRQVRLRGFLVGALLSSVNSAQGCSICGDGYQVGSPFAVTTVSFQEQADCQYSCIDLEFAGLNGLILSEDCSVLPSLVFETCDCQANTKPPQSMNEYSDPQHGSGYSNQRRANSWFAPRINTSPPVVAPIIPPVAAPSPPVATPFLQASSPPVATPFLQASSPPVAAPAFSPERLSVFSPALSTASFDPTYAPHHEAPITPSNTKPRPDPSVIIAMSVIGSVVLVIFVTCSASMMMSSRDNATPPSRPAIGQQIRATPITLPMIPVPTPMQLKEQALARRPLVLAVLFPDEGKHEGDGEEHTSGRNLKYDAPSQRYIFGEDPEATSCSICMETLVPEDDTVTGLCSHIYHRVCIMNWLKGGHDVCPNCRQPMWDPETYKIVDQQIMDQNSGSPSARDIIAVC